MPLLGETDCRLAEIVGLKLEDIDLENDLIYIRPNSARRLKTRGSQRTLPLFGYVKLAMEQAYLNSQRANFTLAATMSFNTLETANFDRPTCLAI